MPRSVAQTFGARSSSGVSQKASSVARISASRHLRARSRPLRPPFEGRLLGEGAFGHRLENLADLVESGSVSRCQGDGGRRTVRDLLDEPFGFELAKCLSNDGALTSNRSQSVRSINRSRGAQSAPTIASRNSPTTCVRSGAASLRRRNWPLDSRLSAPSVSLGTPLADQAEPDGLQAVDVAAGLAARVQLRHVRGDGEFVEQAAQRHQPPVGSSFRGVAAIGFAAGRSAFTCALSRTVGAVGRIGGMDAQEHYREAEHLISAPKGATRPREHDVALAQVHAVLALTATLAEANLSPFYRTPESPLPHR